MFFPDDRHEPTHSGLNKQILFSELYEERILSMSKQLSLFFKEIEGDEIFKVMQESPLSHEYVSQRAVELFREIMSSEQEITIHNLQNDLVEVKSLNLNLKSDNQQLLLTLKNLEEKLRKSDLNNNKLLDEYDSINLRLAESEAIFEEKLKFKDLEWMHKLEENMKKSQSNLYETEQRFYNTKKELDSVTNLRKNSELLCNEIERLKKDIKSQENYSSRHIDELKLSHEMKISQLLEKISDLEDENKDLRSQFKTYQRQSEELASDHQSVIKNLVDKSKALKQKVISQKSKISSVSKQMKDSSIGFDSAKEGYLKTIEELEVRIKQVEKEASIKENEMLNKHQIQLSQLKLQYQQMLDSRLLEMQKEVEQRIAKSQEHDHEVKSLMDAKMVEIQQNFVPKILYEKTVQEKEVLNKKNSKMIEDLNAERLALQENMGRQIYDLRQEKADLEECIGTLQKTEQNLRKDIVRDKERYNNDLNTKIFKLKESENSKNGLMEELEKTRQEYSDLQNEYDQDLVKWTNEKKGMASSISDLKSSAASEKKNFLKEIEKNTVLEKEVAKKNAEIQHLSEQVNSLHANLRELKNKQLEDLKHMDIEQMNFSQTKLQLKELEDYSQTLLNEIEIKESNEKTLQEVLENYKNDVRKFALMVDAKEKELGNVKLELVDKDNEFRVKIKNISEKVKKCLKNSVFFLKKQILSISEQFEYEYAAMNKNFEAVLQEVSLKIVEIQMFYRQQVDMKSEEYIEDIKEFYRSRFSQIEDFILQENICWSDPETEGIRRAVKSILEKKHIGQVEIKTLRETISKLTEQNEGLYRENQKLHLRLHANNEAFDQLQREVTEEAHKIKVRLETGVKERLDYSGRSHYYRN